MSLCQSKQSSCGACCGLFNLDYPHQKLKNILDDRTSYFTKEVDYTKKETVIAFREKFEIKESIFPKKDNTIYNCPFLGYINGEKTKIGCMIHPVKTGDPKSQNFSFYGASICQSYDCKNKERDTAENWEEVFDSVGLNVYQYSMLAADHILISRVEDFFLECGISKEIIFQNYNVLVRNILKWKLKNYNPYITSFEIDMETNVETSKFQKLINYLNLKPNDELYLQIKEVTTTNFQT